MTAGWQGGATTPEEDGAGTSERPGRGPPAQGAGGDPVPRRRADVRDRAGPGRRAPPAPGRGPPRRLAEDLRHRGSGLAIREVAGGWRMSTHPDAAPVRRAVRPVPRHSRLTRASLETLAVVAYKQPVTRHQVSSIRGADSDGVLRSLAERGLVQEVGRDDGPGRAVLYGTTTAVPGAAGPRVAGGPPAARPAARRCRAAGGRPRDDLGADPARSALDRDPPDRAPGADRPTRASASRRSWPGPGFGSRRASEDLIREGRVRIGDRVATRGPGRPHPRPGDRGRRPGADPSRPPVLRDQQARRRDLDDADPHAARTVAAFLPAGPRVYPVGRLDRESEGLLLLTNDGELAHRLQHPSYGVEKEYLVEVAGAVSRSDASPGYAPASTWRTGPPGPGPGRSHRTAGPDRRGRGDGGGPQARGPTDVRRAGSPGRAPGPDPDRAPELGRFPPGVGSTSDRTR